MKKIIITLIFVSILFLPIASSAIIKLDEPTQPTQPNSGPGGSDYQHNSVRKFRYDSGGNRYWIFEPYDPKPESAPLIVFLHGWCGLHPIFYRGWILHIVKRGNIVVYPQYQKGFFQEFDKYTSNAINAVKGAIDKLQNGGHVAPELDKFAITGHSVGGGLTANMAALAQDEGLPYPKAIMPVQPAIIADRYEQRVNFSNIPADTLMLVIVAEKDLAVGNDSAKIIFKNTTQIPFTNKDFVIQVTDTYGEPDIIANHIAPVCFPFFRTVDAMDYFSTWKLFDALTDFAFYGINKEYCLGNTPEQRFMGLWSDSTPVNELIVTDYP